MSLVLDHYLREVDALLLQAGAESEIFAEVGGYALKGYSLIRKNAPVVYISTGMHGDEPAGPLALLELLEGGLLERNLTFYFCPCLNPTGLVLKTRENAPEYGGVDMNRDYMLRQTTEVAGHVKWLEKLKPKPPELFISLHEDWESGGYYFYEINCRDDKPERYEYIVGRLRDVMLMEVEPVIDEHKVRREGWIYHQAEADRPEGWPEAIYVAKNSCPLSFTFESPSALAMTHRVTAHVVAVNSVLDYEYGDK